MVVREGYFPSQDSKHYGNAITPISGRTIIIGIKQELTLNREKPNVR